MSIYFFEWLRCCIRRFKKLAVCAFGRILNFNHLPVSSQWSRCNDITAWTHVGTWRVCSSRVAGVGMEPSLRSKHRLHQPPVASHCLIRSLPGRVRADSSIVGTRIPNRFAVQVLREESSHVGTCRTPRDSIASHLQLEREPRTTEQQTPCSVLQTLAIAHLHAKHTQHSLSKDAIASSTSLHGGVFSFENSFSKRE